MSTEILCTIISALTTIAVAILGIFQAREAKKNRKVLEDQDIKANRRKKESLLALKMQNASLELSIVCANALTGGHNNGNVEEAKKAAQKAREDYEQFLIEVMAEDRVVSRSI